MEEKTYTISEACHVLGVPRHAIGNLCNRGYMPQVKRDKRHRRIFSQPQIDLLFILLQMRQSGFTSSEIRQYARLYRQGEATAHERLAILTTRKHQLQNEIKERQAAIDFIERQEELAEQTKGEL